jgi:hypothetical protein
MVGVRMTWDADEPGTANASHKQSPTSSTETPAYATSATTPEQTHSTTSSQSQPTPTSNGNPTTGAPHTSQAPATHEDAHTPDANAQATPAAEQTPTNSAPHAAGEWRRLIVYYMPTTPGHVTYHHTGHATHADADALRTAAELCDYWADR